ncbi:MAG: polysaccharide deacetylase family protein [Parasporobacterium sp.]|nr:polysaccharide deacetylase family protein [Parasporobacterium sp.]
MTDIENKHELKKLAHLREASAVSDAPGRSAKKARSFRQETYRPADPDHPKMQKVIINSAAFINRAPEEDLDISYVYDNDDNTETDTKTSSVSDDFFNGFNEPDNSEDAHPEETVTERQYNETAEEDLTEEDSPKSATRKNSVSSRKPSKTDNSNTGLVLKRALCIAAIVVAVVLVLILIISGSNSGNVGEITVESTNTSQTLKWSGSNPRLTYEIYRSENNGSPVLIDTVTDGVNSITYNNLTPGTHYNYRIVTVKQNGEKTEGTYAESYTTPEAVSSPSAVTLEKNSLTARWSLNGSCDEYQLQYGKYDNLRDAVTISFTMNDTVSDADGTYSYTIGNLTEDETYYMSIRTLCKDTASEWSNVFSGTVTEASQIKDVDSGQPMVALTFDGGPDGNGYTERILNVLAEHNSHATFFQTGEHALEYPDIMKRIIAEGHEMGNHTYDESHAGDEVTADDIISANTAIQSASGISPLLFRAPQGLVTDTIKETCAANGMSIVLWNFDSHDWEYTDSDSIIDRIKTYVEDGDIIQFRNIYDETATAIEELVPYLIDNGYQLVTVSQLINAKTESLPAAGITYYSGTQSE